MKRSLIGLSLLLAALTACATAQRQVAVELLVTLEGKPLGGVAVQMQDLRNEGFSVMPRPIALAQGQTDDQGTFDSGTMLVEGTIDITVEGVHCAHLGGNRQIRPGDQKSSVVVPLDVERHTCK